MKTYMCGVGLEVGGGVETWEDGGPVDYIHGQLDPSNHTCVSWDIITDKWQDDDCTTQLGYLCMRGRFRCPQSL